MLTQLKIIKSPTNDTDEYQAIFFNHAVESQEQRKAQVKLNQFYNRFLSPPENYRQAPDDLNELAVIRKIEDAWNYFEENKIKEAYLPHTAETFASWYQEVNQQHKDKVRHFFTYLAERASLEEIAYYICLEEKVDGSFDDMIALAQLGVKGYAKLVMAENYWDEMGHGKEREMHTAMFAVSANYMKNLLKGSTVLSDEGTVAGLKNGNMLIMYALRRKYIPRLLGAIGILEDTASERFSATVNGLKRYNIPYDVIEYHEAHIHIDSNHGEQWLKHILLPLVKTEDSELIREIAKGVLIRFNIAADYYVSIEERIADLRQELATQSR